MKDQLILKEQLKVILIIVFVYILPVLLLFSGWCSFAWRFAILILINIIVILITRLYSFTLEELGITRNNLGKSIKAIALPTLVFSLLMLINYLIYGVRIDNSAYGLLFYLFFVIISSPLQEFLYRGFLFGIFNRAKFPDRLKILLSTLLYSFVHLIYRDIPTLLLTLLIGLFWSWHYNRFGNLYSVIISHSILGAIAILIGLV